MSNIQKIISFPSKKRFTSQYLKRESEKENASTLQLNSSTNLVTETSPVKHNENILTGIGASPPKIKKLDEPKNSGKPDDNVNVPNDILNIDDSLAKAIKVLHASQPTKLKGRSDKVAKISQILEEASKTKKSTTLYISGPPGTGKTACLNYIISQTKISGNYKIVYLNCTGLKSSSAAFKRIAESLGLKLGTSERKNRETIETYLSSCRKMIMLVLDEMDQLESKKQALLYTIFEWPNIFKNNMVLIGIANALDLTDRLLPRLQAKLEITPILINFPSYSREEIIDILSDRLKEAGVDSILDSGALQLLASKVAAVSGDIRKALDIGRRVLEITESKPNTGKAVSLLDVLDVVNNVYGTSGSLVSANAEGGESFPLHQKLLICTVVLIKKNSKNKELSLGKVHDVYRKVCGQKNLTALEISEFISLTQLVESRGVIRTQGKAKNRLSKVLLLWDEGEITNAIQDKQLLASILDDLSCLK